LERNQSTAALACDCELNCRIGGCIHTSVGVWKSSHEAIKNRVIEFRDHDPGSTDRESNLLLMMPSLCQLASCIKPVQRGFLSGPTHREKSSGKRIKRLMKTGALLGGVLHHVDQDV
jgi:hypothetical protein